ncbi:FAD/FMN-containing dehydrogenase [Geosmithia morbida]|uniref:FAD/FMN-containing dehydrogenase n=1 Tax=Geosmithia morbida TaxID=1094350 RepID=A0A9P4YRQ1_9HYPO|nr:FAD/FMN-containing dehydrogenase [Geosmithia morbida]KAF4120607.1 FAD/FMN-containing dehydrogenase [Geosmithia morbida]
MASLDSLKSVLKQHADGLTQRQLSERQYSAGFEIFWQAAGWKTYENFIIPGLNRLLEPLISLRSSVSILEIGPGPKSLVGYLQTNVRERIREYTAYESDSLSAVKLQKWISQPAEGGYLLPNLERPPVIHQAPFGHGNDRYDTNFTSEGLVRNYDVILFCHSMYGMKPGSKFIERALQMLTGPSNNSVVVVFHRETGLELDGLVCQQMATFHEGVIHVENKDETILDFSHFIVGFDLDLTESPADDVYLEWLETCRSLSTRGEDHPNHLVFSAPEIMMAFTSQAKGLQELLGKVVSTDERRPIKNWEARLHRAASIIRPMDVRDVQHCIQWAIKHEVGLTVISGGHSSHCLEPNVVAVDMAAFDQVHVLNGDKNNEAVPGMGAPTLVAAGAGCKVGDIVRTALEAGVQVPLGSRPSVGAGSWLQGGIGHLARSCGLACDAIVGAVVVSPKSGQLLCVGNVPRQLRTPDLVRPEDEADLMWAVKGAGTNIGIVLWTIFEASAASSFAIRKCVVLMEDGCEAQKKIAYFDSFAQSLPKTCSADAYIWDDEELHLGVTMFESGSTSDAGDSTAMTSFTAADPLLGLAERPETLNHLDLFEAEMYMSTIHGGHGGGKTDSFKRCVFLKNIGSVQIAGALVKAVQSRPTPFCYLHLLHGGGSVSEVGPGDTAFGSRDWSFACVVTGVWPRGQSHDKSARTAVSWVYTVVRDLLPWSSGVYSADLGNDSRDAPLAAKAFGPNIPRLSRLKARLDPFKLIRHACPLPEPSNKQRIIILVTGESGAGKDYCAAIWASMFANNGMTTHVASISDATKRAYSLAEGANFERLLGDRAYKEKHRPELTAFFKRQLLSRPSLMEENFLQVVEDALDVDVLFITGLRDEAPATRFSHTVPDRKLLDVRVQASEEMRSCRRGALHDDASLDEMAVPTGLQRSETMLYRPSLVFDNSTSDGELARGWSNRHLLPLMDENLQRLNNMVRLVPGFPRPTVKFRHVLGVAQQPGGLSLCASLLRSHFADDWSRVERVACCEAGGYIFASALAHQVNLPLILIREAGKLPPPVVSAIKRPSHISSSSSSSSGAKKIEMELEASTVRGQIVVVDDVLATGNTLGALLMLLKHAGINTDNVSVLVVAEFPAHRARENLRMRGFGSPVAYLASLLPAALGCGDDDGCYGPSDAVEHTDTHGWLEGHIKEQNYGADWGDFVSFSGRMKQAAGNMGVDLLLIDTGDLHDGTGLSDATDVDGEKSMTIFNNIDYDLLTIGNHELYVSEVSQQMFTVYSEMWGDRYVTSNVKIFNQTTGQYEYVGATHRYFTTKQGLRIMAFGVLFDFTGNSNASQVIKASDMVKEQWFKDALTTSDPIDMFILFGHNPVRPTDDTSTFKIVWDAMREARPTTPIQIFGGHTHIRDFAVYDNRSVGIESGRYCETLGWMSMSGFDSENSGFRGAKNPRGVKNPTHRATNSSVSPFLYSRRYMDWNRNTFIYHSRIPANTFDRHAGEVVTQNITGVRKELKLGEVYGCAPETYCISCVPFEDEKNIFPAVIVPAVASIVINESRAGTPRIILGNTGAVRFDLHKGPFTYDDNFIVSPFSDVFLYIPDVPFSKADTIIDQLNKGGADKRSIFASMPTPRDACTDPIIGTLGRRQVEGPRGIIRRQEPVTSGYVTSDDWGTDGDDSVHTNLPDYTLPDYWESRAGFPKDDTNPDSVDLIFLDFIQDYILEYLGDDYSDDMVECYIDCEFTSRDFMLPYAKSAWQKNIDNCTLSYA